MAATTLAPMAVKAAKKRFTKKSPVESSPSIAEPRYQKKVFDSLDKPNKNERYVDLALRM